MQQYSIKPITLKQSYEFCNQHHRHNKGTTGHKFSIGLLKDDEMIGVCVVGLPIARHNNDGYTAEILRTCVLDDYRNANSMLYGAVCRACKAMGFKKVITYTLKSESGSSLKAAGFCYDGDVRINKNGWDMPGRKRAVQEVSLLPKQRWRRTL